MSGGAVQPETALSTVTVYEGKVIKVRVDRVRLADGRESVREVVEYPQSVVIVPIDFDDNVILVRQYRYAIGDALLEAPAGKCDEGEGPAETAQRELQEETGYRAGDLQFMASYWTGPGLVTEYMHAFLARDLEESPLAADDDEKIVVEHVPLGRVHDMIRDGTIRDGKTIATLLMALHVYDRNSSRRR